MFGVTMHAMKIKAATIFLPIIFLLSFVQYSLWGMQCTSLNGGEGGRGPKSGAESSSVLAGSTKRLIEVARQLFFAQTEKRRVRISQDKSSEILVGRITNVRLVDRILLYTIADVEREALHIRDIQDLGPSVEILEPEKILAALASQSYLLPHARALLAAQERSLETGIFRNDGVILHGLVTGVRLVDQELLFTLADFSFGETKMEAYSIREIRLGDPHVEIVEPAKILTALDAQPALLAKATKLLEAQEHLLETRVTSASGSGSEITGLVNEVRLVNGELHFTIWDTSFSRMVASNISDIEVLGASIGITEPEQILATLASDPLRSTYYETKLLEAQKRHHLVRISFLHGGVGVLTGPISQVRLAKGQLYFKIGNRDMGTSRIRDVRVLETDDGIHDPETILTMLSSDPER
ncbi:MAG: hypothetical protein C5B49_11155 [Bdellovibrio sp.]|nr:MAG: hypothetical protein C5B49_11155 [Bdellovibrio sp.]